MARAIDVHVHPALPRVMEALAGKPAAVARFFNTEVPEASLDQTAELYRNLEVRAVLLNVDAETTTGVAPVPNDLIADACRKHPDVFTGFAGIDPAKGQAALYELERAVHTLGLRGLKLHPGVQRFFPDDPHLHEIWSLCEHLDIPVLLHTGMMAAGAGTPGGGGLRLQYTRPIPHIDNVAAEHPNLTIIMAHPGWPWQDEQLAVARHKANTYIDLSGWSPRYFPPSIVQMGNTLLQDKLLFGSDYPFISPTRWLADFERTAFRDEVRQKILYGNAARVLKLEG